MRFVELRLDALDRVFDTLAGDDEVAGRIDGHAIPSVELLAGQRIDLMNALDLIAEHLDPNPVLLVGGIDFHDVTANAEGAAAERHIIPAVLDVHEPAENYLSWDGLPDLNEQHQALEAFRITQPVDAGHAGDDYHVVTGDEIGRRLQAQAIDIFVDRGVLLDIRVGRGQVGLGLVVVIVGNEVPDGVMREVGAEFPVELSRERLVVADDERRKTELGNNVRDRERLARSRDTEERLKTPVAFQPLHELIDRLRLIPRREVARGQLKP